MVPFDAAILLAFLIAAPLLAALFLLFWAIQKVARRRGHIPRDKVSWVEKKWVAWPAAVLLAIYGACFAWGALVEAHWVQLTKTEIRVQRPVLGYDRFRIVHLSDFHLERVGRREHRVVELVREARPHLILLTGDYMKVREGGAALVEILRALQAPHGVYGVEGNNDPKFITRDLFRTAGVEYLEDRTKLIERGGHRLRLVGHSIYPNTPLKELLSDLHDNAYCIYLQHKPDAVDELLDREPGQRVDLFLCGHTHGGQVCLPFWGAIVTESKYHKKYERGLYELQGVPMYVNRGIGVQGLPVRFLSRPEVAVIDLVVK